MGAGSIAQHSVRSKHSAISKHQEQGSEKSTMLGSDEKEPALVISCSHCRVSQQMHPESIWYRMQSLQF
jgi:hypothetical protein